MANKEMPTTAQLREYSEEELRLRLQEAKKEKFNLRVKLKTGEAANSNMMTTWRREVARIETLLTEKRTKGQS